MNNKSDKTEQKKTKNPREDRLKAALKANLGRRKAQARTRKASEGNSDITTDKTES